ncbi:MAG: DUF4390 domain-containing protein [Gammaproteobacteria bacterium]|nr:DUF4390 domain-containing protein [Gammaproteobacteria bacterium]
MGSPANLRKHFYSLVTAGLVVLSGLLALPAQAEDGVFSIRSAYTSEIDGVYFLNATIDYQLNEMALEALARGVVLTFELNIDLRRVQRFRPDKTVAELLQLNELSYHALSGKYLVRNTNSGEQQSFLTLSAALQNLGIIRDLPIIDGALLNPKRRYFLRLKSVLDIRSFPGPLRVLAVFFGDWRLASDWYRWTLLP